MTVCIEVTVADVRLFDEGGLAHPLTGSASVSCEIRGLSSSSSSSRNADLPLFLLVSTSAGPGVSACSLAVTVFRSGWFFSSPIGFCDFDLDSALVLGHFVWQTLVGPSGEPSGDVLIRVRWKLSEKESDARKESWMKKVSRLLEARADSALLSSQPTALFDREAHKKHTTVSAQASTPEDEKADVKCVEYFTDLPGAKVPVTARPSSPPSSPPSPPHSGSPPSGFRYSSYFEASVAKGTLPSQPGCPSPTPERRDRAVLGHDFNERFEQAVDRIRELSIREVPDARERMRRHANLVSLHRDFLHTARVYGRIIIEERFLPEARKSIKPLPIGGIAGGQKFIVNGVLFKFAVDHSGVFSGDDALSAKVAGHELKSIVATYNTQLPIGLPLIALIDFRGFRLVAESVLPIGGRSTLVAGSPDAGRSVVDCAPRFRKVMTELGKALNLRPHSWNDGGEKRATVFTALDTEAHEGLDGRFYLLDLSRTFPPEGPPTSKLKCSYLFRLLRPELVKKFRTPLCSDSFSNFIPQDEAKEANADVVEATSFLKGLVIPQFAISLIRLVAEAMVRGELLDFQLKTEMHSRGINLRHLGLVFAAVQQMSKPRMSRHSQIVVHNARTLLVIEMVVRAIRSRVNQQLRIEAEKWVLPMEAPFMAIYVETFRKLASSTPGSQQFWETVLRDIAAKFEVELRPETANVLNELCTFHPSTFAKDVSKSAVAGHHALLVKLQKLTGLKLKRTVLKFVQLSPANFEAAMPIINSGDVKVMKEVVKDMNVIPFAEGYELRILSSSTVDPGYTEDRAIAKFGKALMANPNNTATLRNLAQMLIKKAARQTIPRSLTNLKISAIEKAYTLFLRALATGEYNPETHFQWAEFLSNVLGEEESAMEEVLKALDLSPSHVRALKLASELCCHFGFPKEATALASRAEAMQAVHLATPADIVGEPAPPASDH